VQPCCMREAHSEDGLGGGTDDRDYPVSFLDPLSELYMLIDVAYRCDSGSRHYSRVCELPIS